MKKVLILSVGILLFASCATDENWRTKRTRYGGNTSTESVYDPKPEDINTRNQNAPHTADAKWIHGYREGAGTDNEGNWVYGYWATKSQQQRMANQNSVAKGKQIEVQHDFNEQKNSPKGSGNWSDFQGVMRLKDAKAKCKSLTMRLPAIKELEAAYKTGATDLWQNDAYVYWSSTAVGRGLHRGGAYGLYVVTGITEEFSYGEIGVRCIR